MSSFKHQFGTHIRSLRKARGLTQDELSGRSDLSSDTVRRIEAGQFCSSIDTVRKLAFGLNVSLATLFESFELGDSQRRELVDLLASSDDRQLRIVLRTVRVLLDELEQLGRGAPRPSSSREL